MSAFSAWPIPMGKKIDGYSRSWWWSLCCDGWCDFTFWLLHCIMNYHMALTRIHPWQVQPSHQLFWCHIEVFFGCPNGREGGLSLPCVEDRPTKQRLLSRKPNLQSPASLSAAGCCTDRYPFAAGILLQVGHHANSINPESDFCKENYTTVRSTLYVCISTVIPFNAIAYPYLFLARMESPWTTKAQ